MVKEFNKVNLKTLRSEIDAALKAVADKNGITLGIGNISFTSDRFTCRLTAQTKSQVTTEIPGSVSGTIAGLFKIGDSFKHNTKVLTITDYNPSKPKNCIVVKDQNGKSFTCSLDFVKSKLK